MSSLLRKNRRENQREATIECCNCGAVIKRESVREYMDQDGRLCKPCWEKALVKLCGSAT